MSFPELSEYVTDQITRGVSAQTVREALIEAGWRSVDADNALRDAAAHAAPVATLTVQDDLSRIRHAVNDLGQRVSRLEGSLTGVAAPATLPDAFIGPERELAPGRPRVIRLFGLLGLAVLFAAAGYWGMMLISTESWTPAGRIWAEAGAGTLLAVAGFAAGRRGSRGTANILTGVGLALGALATVGGWYLNYLEWSVAVALGALLVTLALVLGRFYDRWAR
ncbi:MAG TPA: hypothetical protein VD862_00740 [Candidatus Paceibacterota bacterium]|nr:hypothetical protein [Candidatus Paceibacterota bacterium]